MGKIYPPEHVKLFVSLILSDKLDYNLVADKLQNRFGKIELENEIVPFEYTTYYKKEMGSRLRRTHLAFSPSICPSDLAEIKVFTNELEFLISDNRDQMRCVNIDPGYLTLSKIVLATTKDFSHRIYLDKGIFAEVTLIYSKKNGWESLLWTYPDYKGEHAKNFFNTLRTIFYNQLRDEKFV